jgi:uncharacterized protein YqjF (DUF2071 family)
MNFRTYVRVDERPGIFFFTLDAASYTAVLATRLVYGLPYRHADMDIEITKSGVSYRSRRHDGSAELVARYSATGTAFLPQPDTLEHFLTERYALYVVRLPGVTWRGDIHHKPWRIQPADADLLRNTVPQAHGLAVADHRPVLHFAARQDTLAWLPKLVAAA